MKKIYFSPETKVLTINTATLMAGSFNETLKDTAVDDSSTDFTQYSRSSGLWDDEE